MVRHEQMEWRSIGIAPHDTITLREPRSLRPLALFRRIPSLLSVTRTTAQKSLRIFGKSETPSIMGTRENDCAGYPRDTPVGRIQVLARISGTDGELSSHHTGPGGVSIGPQRSCSGALARVGLRNPRLSGKEGNMLICFLPLNEHQAGGKKLLVLPAQRTLVPGSQLHLPSRHLLQGTTQHGLDLVGYISWPVPYRKRGVCARIRQLQARPLNCLGFV